MATTILATKLYVPPPRLGIVQRSRLFKRLNQGKHHKLILISASAGFGKTTLVSEWIATQGVRVGWLSLDEGDSDPNRFMTYLVAALQTIKPNIGKGALAALHSSQSPPIESILTILLNEITAISDSFILVLDDYHAIDSETIDHALTFLIDHSPLQMHLVIATRENPSLPLARLRARGQLTELRATDLRFTPAEALEFLNQVMSLNLSAEDITALENRTEGWITGLQLAALSMQNRQDTVSFIKSFTGSHRFVLDYLVEEVLQHQSERVRSFLLQTSILERLCGPLCNAITDYEDSKTMLEALERGNLFVIPLDDQRQWYRYHHLFAEVLLNYLGEEQPDSVSTLHQRASLWFEQNDLPAEAIRHALTAKDFERAANLIERVWPAMDLNYQHVTWLGWAKVLPDDLVRAHPVISVGYAWALLGVGELEASEARLQDAEQWLNPVNEQPENSTMKMVVVDEVEFKSLSVSIAAARAYRALALGDIPGTKKYARQTVALVTEDTSPHHTQGTALLGLAEYASGDLQAAEQELLKFQEMMWRGNDIASAIGITFILANIKQVQGRLHEAVNAYRQSLRLAESKGAPSFLGACDLHRGLGELLCEQGDFEAAAQHLRTAQQLGEADATTGWPQRLCVAQARMKEAQGDLVGALVLLAEAERQKVRNPLPDRPIAALKARMWARQGRLSEAMSWVREQGLSADDALSYMREFEHLTLARVLIARYKADRVDDNHYAALRLLERLLQAAEEGGRMGSVIEISILQALAYQVQGDETQALVALEHALTLAEPEGYVRVFVDEGKVMRLLLEKQSRNGNHSLNGYVYKLLAAFAPPGEEQTRMAPKSAIIHQESDMIEPEVRPVKNMLVEPLSERELEVLRLLRSELSGPEIAQILIVSLNTLRTHTKNIFTKLGVSNRRAAVHRAEELGLF